MPNQSPSDRTLTLEPALEQQESSKVTIIKYSEDLLEEINDLLKKNELLDAVLVDASMTGFLFPSEVLLECSKLVPRLIDVGGALIFLSVDGAVAVIRESLSSPPQLRIFSNYRELFDLSTHIRHYVKLALGKDTEFATDRTDLAQQILMSITPVLTDKGIDRKTAIEASSKQNMILSLIDNYSSLASLVERCKERMNEEQVLEILKELEKDKTIYPIFSKVPFLVESFKNQGSFSIQEYFLRCQILTQQQIDALLLELQGMPKRERMTLGALAVKKEWINSRQLEVAMQDQTFYGPSESNDKVKGAAAGTAEEKRVQSLVGHLGSTDPMSLLQNMATNRDTGILSVENRDMQFKCYFEAGKAAYARMGKMHGNDSVVEFASAWRQGIFVFMKRENSEDLDKPTCKLTKALDKLLLDAALAQDNTDVVWKKLPTGIDAVLEKVEARKEKLDGEPLIDPKEKKPLTKNQMELCKRIWSALDGLTHLHRVIKNLQDVTTADAAYCVGILWDYKLVKVPEGDLTTPLERFQLLISSVKEQIGSDRSNAFLRLSFRDTLGYSAGARVFILSNKGEVGIDMVAIRRESSSLTNVLQDLENWQVKYIEYISQELDKQMLLSIIHKIHDKGQSQ